MVRYLSVILFFTLVSCSKKETFTPIKKIEEITRTNHKPLFKGINYESPANIVGPETFHSVVNINANSISIIPFGFISNGGSTISFNSTNQWWGEKDEGVIALTQYAKSQNLKVMVKPQIWIWGGSYTGDYEPVSEIEWQNLESSYYEYIIHYADIADSINCELFCIGTEWKKFHQMRPTFWSNLIDSTKMHFKGELTYAGNWDSYNTFTHWDKLDYIGIDAYFPVSNSITPTIEECKTGWQTNFESIKNYSIQFNKPVIFTEYGYRSIDKCGEQPWSTSNIGNVNLAAQNNAYQALFDIFWDQSWFEGGFLWKWKAIHSTSGGSSNKEFTPQNKLVEQTIKDTYK